MEKTTAANPKKVLSFIKKNISLSAFVVILLLFLCILGTRFIAPDNILTIVEQSCVTLVVSFGMTFVIVSGGIDLSVGSVVALSGVISASVYAMTKNFLYAFFIGVAIGLACGAFNGFVHAKLKIPSFIATLGMMSIARALAEIYSKGSVVMIPEESGLKTIGKSPTLIIIAVAFFVLSYILQKYTVFGRYVRMIGGDENVANLCGIKVTKIKITLYTLCGVFAAIGGMLLAGRIGSGSPASGNGFEMDCITAVVLGGTPMSGGIGSVSGTVIGALILAMLSNGLILMGVASEVQLLIKGFVLIGAVFMSLDRKKIGVIK